MVIKFICEYIGKGFHGFQRQKNLRTVQSVLEDALSKYFGDVIKISGSGRTDAGVHAKGQVCSFIVVKNTELDEKNLYKLNSAANAFLPQDVSVRDFQIMDDGFHAQFSAKAKTYVYKCYVGRHRSALRCGTHLHLFFLPDIKKMQEAAKDFVGTRSFREFTTDKTDGKDFIRTVYSFEVYTYDDEINFVVKGDGFMRNMVRIMCGRILDIGYGCIKARTRTLPSHGLFLESVEY